MSFCCNLCYDDEKEEEERLQKAWDEYKTIALEKLPEEGGIREPYISGYFFDESVEEVVARLVLLLQDHPNLSLRDLFALCESRVELEARVCVAKRTADNAADFHHYAAPPPKLININAPIVPIEDEVERCKIVNDTIISYCNEALADEEFECTNEEDIPALKETLKDAKGGRFQTFDRFYELLGSFGGTFETASQDIAFHWNDGTRTSMIISGMEVEFFSNDGVVDTIGLDNNCSDKD